MKTVRNDSLQEDHKQGKKIPQNKQKKTQPTKKPPQQAKHDKITSEEISKNFKLHLILVTYGRFYVHIQD